MKIIADIAQQVADHLNSAPGGTFPAVFTAEFLFDPIRDLEKIAALEVLVVPRPPETPDQADRETDIVEITIDIGVRRKVDPNNIAQMSGLLALLDAIEAYLNRSDPELADGDSAAWASSEIDPYNFTLLREHRIFMGVVTIRYRAERSHPPPPPPPEPPEPPEPTAPQPVAAAFAPGTNVVEVEFDQPIAGGALSPENWKLSNDIADLTALSAIASGSAAFITFQFPLVPPAHTIHYLADPADVVSADAGLAAEPFTFPISPPPE